ncbi:MAG TPA: phosphatidate cytidylyltransferase [Novosphingobium sp.]|nr:phosphatidate cytidylyltransferase [Novosphingobium sp.]
MAGGDSKGWDLGVRAASAVVMVVVAGTALWLGGWVWTLFVAAVTLGVFLEWQALSGRFSPDGLGSLGWLLGGIAYIGVASYTLTFLRGLPAGLGLVLTLAGMVIATDIGAYFAGRAIGGPKIAPAISPSKTWAGLGGGIAGASLVLFAALQAAPMAAGLLVGGMTGQVLASVLGGALVAVVAQSGDFFESWMKRRAGGKDSGGLIPGHGGLFDRVDGLLAVLFVTGIGGWALFLAFLPPAMLAAP